MLTLRPMSQEVASVYLETVIDEYERVNIKSGRWSEEIARDEAKAAIKRILPEGLATKGQYLYELIFEGESIGNLWLAQRIDGDVVKAFVYDINVDESLQGRGLGKAAMQLAEDQAQQWSADAIGLHVFDYNERAIGLYEKLGYRNIDQGKESRLMEKSLRDK